MNWRESLAQELQYRNGPKENCTEKYNDLLKKVIRPTLLEIIEELHKHDINSVVERDELKIEYGFSVTWFKFKIDRSEDCKTKFSAFYPNLNAPDFEIGVQPKLVNGYEKEIEIELVKSDLMGEIFYEAFKPVIKYYNGSRSKNGTI